MTDRKQTPPIDLAKHGAAVRKLMQSWRFSQGNRAAGGIVEVMQALEFIALPVANQQAFAADPVAVVLSRKQVRLGQHRAISAQRRAEHGPPEQQSAEGWWEQVEAIARRWKIETTREEWTAKQPQKAAA